jgi:hypothetical protein
MTALASLSDVVNRITGGNSGSPEQIWFGKTGRVAGAGATALVAGRWSSMWQYEGWPGGAGAAPGGTARNPTNATAGSLFQTDPGGGRSKWLLGASCAPLLAGTLMVYDRLADISGLSGTNTAAQTITGLSVSRYTGTAAAGNQIWLEVYTLIGATRRRSPRATPTRRARRDKSVRRWRSATRACARRNVSFPCRSWRAIPACARSKTLTSSLRPAQPATSASRLFDRWR